jgi:hypothetical protein
MIFEGRTLFEVQGETTKEIRRCEKRLLFNVGLSHVREAEDDISVSRIEKLRTRDFTADEIRLGDRQGSSIGFLKSAITG